MFAQCPECLTIFKLGASELAAARGQVRCTHCNATFDALVTLCEQLPSEPIGELDRHVDLLAPPALGAPVFRPPASTQGALFFDPDDRRRSGARGPVTPPQFTRAQRPAQHRRAWPWILGNALLLVALCGQLAWAERARWMDDARVRPWLASACATLGCTLPMHRDRDLLQLVSRDIRPHPSVPNALIISATLQNAADFTQPYPTVEITLSDLDETRIAMRRFTPSEYIPDTEALAAGLAPAANAALVFEVADPGKNAVAFEFRFE